MLPFLFILIKTITAMKQSKPSKQKQTPQTSLDDRLKLNNIMK